MKSKTCAVEDCGNPARARGWCSKHYERYRRHGDPSVTNRVPKGTLCSIEDCENPHLARGLCNRHYRQAMGTTWKWRGSVSECSIKDCDRPGRKRGWCQLHYDRWRRHGDPLKLARTPKGQGSISVQGYRRIMADGERRLEHDVVMERMIGRRLEPGEVVHHRDGDRLNNDPMNLELMTNAEHMRMHAAQDWSQGGKRRHTS